ncbi:hypothetical protein [Sphaerisporangium corydalis]|uniref:Uncharacterized protein n=1 Tax=Sphaerisporangium corydalis TaxID=1441875 RepID=A0ABV9ERY1_9ACTN|nr:hypothetical protein [Sphaerisporangium corydalis]
MAELEIVWVKSAKVQEFRHGMVGEVRAFSLDVMSRPYELYCQLPGPLGVQQIETFTSEQAAYLRAREKLAEFVRLLGQTQPSADSTASDSDQARVCDQEGAGL